MEDLLTDRLILHPFTLEEAQRVAEGVPGPGDNWAADYPSEGERAGAGMFARRQGADEQDLHPWGGYEIRRRSDGVAIGGIGFHGTPGESGTAEIGYGLAVSERGKGYASEALRGMLAAVREWGAKRLIADTNLDNIASQRVMEAVGMVQTGQDEELKFYAIEL
ncbi:GNAT family N-acetyltransferase [Streptomyces tateyamensis]|uniref:GNAT family N-acetyltransferase n=1 Tax=Streptomyces tateyamensis TaxID=565073 RepID=A0A2V4PEW3_9ACTN|nr:GNAT family N-acetyltransferase [Streptomyces tateyamensis]PYC82160.1 GNAT family N-acetyltransferase [Streptomyces tateyamensis]